MDLFNRYRQRVEALRTEVGQHDVGGGQTQPSSSPWELPPAKAERQRADAERVAQAERELAEQERVDLENAEAERAAEAEQRAVSLQKVREWMTRGECTTTAAPISAITAGRGRHVIVTPPQPPQPKPVAPLKPTQPKLAEPPKPAPRVQPSVPVVIDQRQPKFPPTLPYSAPAVNPQPLPGSGNPQSGGSNSSRSSRARSPRHPRQVPPMMRDISPHQAQKELSQMQRRTDYPKEYLDHVREINRSRQVQQEDDDDDFFGDAHLDPDDLKVEYYYPN